MVKIRIDDNVKKTIQEEHYNNIKNRVKDAISKVSGVANYKKLSRFMHDTSGCIDENKLKKLITGDRDELVRIIDIVGEVKLVKNDPFDKLYRNFANRIWAKSLLEIINVRVCPYCNRQYTFTLRNDGVRPQFDHYFPKSLFAYLSVSLYNLIPSCSICNLRKQALNTYEAVNEIFYPYEDEFGLDIIFRTNPIDNDFLYWTGLSNKFDINIICRDKKQNYKVENINKHLKIESLYKQHKDYVRDIIRNAIIYNDSRIDELFEQFPRLFHSKSEVLNSVFMGCFDMENWGKRPLSKLTHDIYNEFKIFVNKV